MFRKFLTRSGLVGSTILISLASIVISLVITLGLDKLAGGKPSSVGLLIAIVVPLVIVPLFCYLFLGVVYQLERAEESLRALSTIDDLTQVFNRRHFFELAEMEQARAARYGDQCSVVLMDLDDFKSINDQYGHQAGDQVLRSASSVCKNASRETDIFARYGGEEFIFLLPRTGLIEALVFTERIRQLLDETAFAVNGEKIHLTASLGVASCKGGAANLDSLIGRADKALFIAKNSGKNCIAHANETFPTAAAMQDKDQAGKIN